MEKFIYQPQLRPALLEVKGCKEYRQERALFIRIDEVLKYSGIEQEFIELSINEKGVDMDKMSQAQIDFFTRGCVMSLRGNVARIIKNLPHREFCVLLPDSTILRWFIGIEQLGGIKAYAKSTSDRFAHWLGEESLQYLNQKLIAALAQSDHENALNLNLEEALDFEQVYFDSTCLKADIHYPTDWVLLRDLTRTLMKGTLIIRREGLLQRMPQDPLEFLSDMNTLVMKMTATSRVKGGKKKRKKIFRLKKKLARRVEKHARNHLALLEQRGHETGLSEGRRNHLGKRLQEILDQVDAAITQAHERIIGERQVKNEDKILSLYDADVNCIVRGKSNASVEFGNKLWLGETQQGLIVDYLLERDQTSDTKHVLPAVERLTQEQALPVKAICGDRGLDSATNTKKLNEQGICNHICPKNVMELKNRLDEEPQLGKSLKRRAGTEARVKIIIHDHMGDKPRAKGFEHRQMMVGWAVFTHNLWVVARLPQKEPEPELALPS